jgi:hypothetical protein
MRTYSCINVYFGVRQSLTFDNGIRSCRKGDKRRHRLAAVILARGDWRHADGGAIISRISLLEPMSASGLCVAARQRMWGLRFAPIHLYAELEGCGTLRQARTRRRLARA